MEQLKENNRSLVTTINSYYKEILDGEMKMPTITILDAPSLQNKALIIREAKKIKREVDDFYKSQLDDVNKAHKEILKEYRNHCKILDLVVDSHLDAVIEYCDDDEDKEREFKKFSQHGWSNGRKKDVVEITNELELLKSLIPLFDTKELGVESMIKFNESKLALLLKDGTIKLNGIKVKEKTGKPFLISKRGK